VYARLHLKSSIIGPGYLLRGLYIWCNMSPRGICCQLGLAIWAGI